VYLRTVNNDKHVTPLDYMEWAIGKGLGYEDPNVHFCAKACDTNGNPRALKD